MFKINDKVVVDDKKLPILHGRIVTIEKIQQMLPTAYVVRFDDNSTTVLRVDQLARIGGAALEKLFP